MVRYFILGLALSSLCSTSVADERKTQSYQLDTGPKPQLVIVDYDIKDKDILVDYFSNDSIIIYIDRFDTIDTIATKISQYKNIETFHWLSHAKPGQVSLAGKNLSVADFAHSQPLLFALNHSLSPQAEILFYGCELGKGKAGKDFINKVAKHTQRAVWASDDLTGYADKGGDWVLEVSSVDTGVRTALNAPEYTYTLNTVTPLVGPSSSTNNNGAGELLLTSGNFKIVATNQNNPSTFITADDGLGAGILAYTLIDDVTLSIKRLDTNQQPDPFKFEGLIFSSFDDSYSRLTSHNIKVQGRSAGALVTDTELNIKLTDTQYCNSDPSLGVDYKCVLPAQSESLPSGFNSPVDEILITITSSDNANAPGSGGKYFDLVSITTSEPPAVLADTSATLTAGSLAEPISLASTANISGNAVDLLDFTITDGGAGDGLPVKIEQLTVKVAGSATDAQRAKITWRLNGDGANNVIGSYDSDTDTLTFSGLNISIVDGTSATYSINGYFNSSGLLDNASYSLTIDGDTDVTVASTGSTTFTTTNEPVSNGSGFTADVVATQLVFTTQPTGSVSGVALTTQPVITAQDAFGNTDRDFTETITLTETSDGSLSGDSVTAVSGVVTFTELKYTATEDQQIFTLTANDQDGVGSDLATVDANAITSDVVATKLVFDTQPAPLSVLSTQATSLTTAPVVSARDAQDLVDLGYTTNIVLSEVNGVGSAAMSALGDIDASNATVTLTPVSGVATYSGLNLTYTAAGGSSEQFNLRASSGGLSTVDSSTITGVVPDTDATLSSATGVVEPIGLATTVDTVGEAVNVFDFTLSDGGSADGLPLEVSQLVVNVSGTASDSQRENITYRLDGPDVTNVTGIYSAASDTITFSGLPISVADHASEIYTINAFYNDNTGVIEDQTLIFSIDGDTDVVVSSSGTQFDSTNTVTNGSGTTLDVTATQLAFTIQPAGSVSGAALTAQPIVKARDAFGNTDRDFTETITLTETSDGSLSGNSVTAVSGVATFTELKYTATEDQQNFTLTANDEDSLGSDLSTTNANAVTSDVVATKLVFDAQPSPLSVKTGEATNLVTIPVVSAKDANDVIDTDYASGITLAEVNGAGSTVMSATGDTDGNGATVTIAPSSGVSTFTAMQLTYTAAGTNSENFNLQASSGGLTTANSSQMTGSVNTPPTFTNLNATPSYTEDGSAVVIDSDATVSDTELDALNGGAGNYDGATLTIARSGGASANDVFGNNGSLGALTQGEALIISGITVGTVTINDNGTLKLTFNSNATTALVNSVLQNITYGNSANEPASAVTLNFTFNDGTENSKGTNQIAATVTAANDAPTLTAVSVNPTFTEDGSPAVLFSSSSASTVESNQTFTGFVLTVSNVTDTGSEALSVGGEAIVLDAGQSGTASGLSYTVAVASNKATVTFTGGTLSQADFQALMDSISYQNNSHDPSTDNSRVVTVTSLTDSGSGNATAALNLASTVSVTPVNDEPTLTATGANPNFTEDGDAAFLFSNASVSTIESAQTLSGFTLTVTNVTDTDNEVINIDGTGIALNNGKTGTTTNSHLTYSVAVNSTTATVTLTDGLLSSSALKAIIDDISYQNNSHDPTVDHSRVITITSLTDNSSNSNANDNVNDTLAVQSTVGITTVNDKPTLTATASAATFTENGNPVAVFTSAGIDTIEADQNIESLTLTLSGLANGNSESLMVDGTTIPLINDVSGTTSANNFNYQVAISETTATVTVTKSDTAASYQTLVDGILYRNSSEAIYLGARVVTLTEIKDSGGVANGGVDTETNVAKVSTITVVGVNDIPDITINQTLVTNEDINQTLIFSYTDVDGDTVTATEKTAPSHGSIVINGTNIIYTPTENYNGSDSFVVTLTDGNGFTTEKTVNVTVDSVNDKPVAIDDNNYTFTQSGAGSYTLDVLANDTDNDNDTLQLAWVVTDTGTASIQDGAIALVTDTIGTVTLKYGVSDANGGTDVGDVTVVINADEAVAPTVTAPAAVAVNAKALFTKVDLGVAVATDSNGNALPVSLVDGNTFFDPGQHTVYWRATDANGQQGTDSQLVTVHPLISISKDDDTTEGTVHSVGVYLNGEAPSYPITIPYTVSGSADGSDHNLANGEITITSGREGSIDFTVAADAVTEGTETVIIALDSSLNLGSKSIYTLNIHESNVAPEVSVVTAQSGENRYVVENSTDSVTVTATVKDANAGDTHTYNWINDNAALANISTRGNVFEFLPEGLTADIYQLKLEVSDGSATISTDIYIEVTEQLATLTTQDSDGDLIPDNEEGYADSDNDGIPDYQDAVSECNVIQEQALESQSYLVEGEPGVCLRKGVTLANNQTGGTQLMTSELIDDTSAENIGGVFDFVAYGLPTVGQSYQVVFPQRLPVPANAVYRKYKETSGWVDFQTDADNYVSSAVGEKGYCPPPGDSVWTQGLTEGHWCVQLTIEDGGPNDDDGIANGMIVDPGGVATTSKNVLPVAVNDQVYVAIDGSLQIDVLANDSDADNDALTIASASASFGTVSIENGVITYTAADKFYGTDTIKYSVTDGNGGTAYANVTVNVTQFSGGVISNSADGGSMGGLAVFMLGALGMVRRHSRKIAASLLALLSFGSQANWYLDADLGQSKAKNRITPFDSYVQGKDKKGTAWSIGLGYQLTPDWAVTGRYLDLGEGSATLSTDSSNPADYHQSVAKVTPVLAEGFAVDVSYALLKDNHASVNAVVGGFSWDVDFDSEYQGTHITSSEQGVDPYIGLNVDYNLTDTWHASWQLTRYFIDLNDVDALTVRLQYRFGN